MFEIATLFFAPSPVLVTQKCYISKTTTHEHNTTHSTSRFSITRVQTHSTYLYSHDVRNSNEAIEPRWQEANRHVLITNEQTRSRVHQSSATLRSCSSSAGRFSSRGTLGYRHNLHFVSLCSFSFDNTASTVHAIRITIDNSF